MPRFVSLLLLAATLVAPAQAWARDPIVAAASGVRFALDEIVQSYEDTTQQRVKTSYGSSGNLARQIRAGAPFDIFLAADESFVLDLADQGFTRGNGDLYAIGQLVIMTPTGAEVKADASLDTLKAALDTGQITRFAIANPEHAPYGQRAKEVLVHKGIWESILPHLVYGENVSQAAQFATSGNTQGGIIAYSLAVAPQVATLGDFEIIPDSWHSPLIQRMILLKGASPEAEAFYAYLQGAQAREIFERFGFTLPEAE